MGNAEMFILIYCLHQLTYGQHMQQLVEVDSTPHIASATSNHILLLAPSSRQAHGRHLEVMMAMHGVATSISSHYCLCCHFLTNQESSEVVVMAEVGRNSCISILPTFCCLGCLPLALSSHGRPCGAAEVGGTIMQCLPGAPVAGSSSRTTLVL